MNKSVKGFLRSFFLWILLVSRIERRAEIRTTVFITVTGKAFFDLGHSLEDQKSKRRSHLPDYRRSVTTALTAALNPLD
jgi:hypothetical protein